MRGQARCGLTAKIRNWVGGPGDYLPTEWLADDFLAKHSFWVYNKAGVVTPLSAWAHHNCGVLARLGISLLVSIMHWDRGTGSILIQGAQFDMSKGPIQSSDLGLTAPLPRSYTNHRTSHTYLAALYGTFYHFSTSSHD